MIRLRLGLLLGLALGLSPGVTQASFTSETALATYGFVNITNNNAADAETGEAQLFVDVYGWDSGVTTDLTDTQVLFLFRNIGPNASSITDVYFDDGTLLDMSSLIEGPGVSFSEGASPGELPGAQEIDPPFQTTAGFLADSDPQVQPNGVNPGEYLGVTFTLKNLQTVSSVINALALTATGPGDGALRIGIKVQGFQGGGSEAFINGPPVGGQEEIPEPSSLILLGMGAFGLIGYRWRRNPLAA